MSIKKLEERITELTEYAEWDDLNEEEVEELTRSKERLHRMKLDASQSPTFDVARIDQMESEKRVLHAFLARFGKEVALERGIDLDAKKAYFDGYTRGATNSWEKEYPKGTRVINVTYGIPMRYEHDYITITFPETYLNEGSDWKEIERKNLAREEDERQAEQAKLKLEKEEKERAELARLQSKYA